MRSLMSETEPSVGLLLFDEPSASLDPRAEHGTLRRFPTFAHRGSLTPPSSCTPRSIREIACPTGKQDHDFLLA